MNWPLIYVLLLLFLLGGLGIYRAGKHNCPEWKKQNWLKYFIYLFIIIYLYGCIMFSARLFQWSCVLIVMFGFCELCRLQRKSPVGALLFYLVLVIFLLIAVGFCLFATLCKSVLLLVLSNVCIFDAFSQISGQLLGRHKLCTTISPNKTYEGLFGGLFFSIIFCPILAYIVAIPLCNAVLAGFFTVVFSFFGDLSASWLKRRYRVKDFSSVIPGHGGFLDRFDSLIASSAVIYLLHFFNSL
jgi:phosphatidate cytidylyltransferase